MCTCSTRVFVNRAGLNIHFLLNPMWPSGQCQQFDLEHLSYGCVFMSDCSYVYPRRQCLQKPEDSLGPLQMGVSGGWGSGGN